MQELKVTSNGLTSQEAKQRLTVYGPNELKKEKGKSPWSMFLGQFTNVLMVILLFATGLSFVVGEVADAFIILAIVIASALLGFIQEYRSGKAVEALKKMAAPNANVIRDGKETRIPANELAPGDLILLYTGDRIPADARLIEAFSMKTDEAPLTGESAPVDKSPEVLPEHTQLNDRRNMVFSGTIIVYGRGKAIVTSTGMNTEFGKIAQMVQSVPQEKTPLEKRMNSLGKWLGIFALVASFGVGIVAIVIENRPVVDMILWSISLAVAAVPEALPAVITGALAIGMYRMAKVNSVVKRLPAVETLGSTNVICTDKTGTLTKGEMTVQRIHVDGKSINVTGIGYAPEGEFRLDGKEFAPDESLKMLLKTAVLCNDSSTEKDSKSGKWTVKGDPTEGALVVAAEKAGIKKASLDKKEKRIAEIPFSSERKRMTTIHAIGNKHVAYMKGAPEIVLQKCNNILFNGKIQPLTQKIIDDHHKITEANALLALRNLGFAFKELSDGPLENFDESIEEGFVFVGIISMIDPPRPEVKDAIAICRKAGIRVVMITGDHKLTATAVARDLTLIGENIEDGQVLTGEELEEMTDEQLETIVEQVVIYARVAPEHKSRIVKAWKKKDQVVAMTGDGVNDAPALKMADIGIAMGISGTEVTKEAADMVLADDNFASIVKAVREGREIFDNIKKYLTYLLQCSVMEILVMFFAVIAVPFLAAWLSPGSNDVLVSDAGIALTAVQILWVNLVINGLPAIALGIDPGDPDLMEQKPRKPSESIFTRNVKVYLTAVPIVTTVMLLFAYFLNMPWESESQLLTARTQLFTAMVTMELAIAISARSLKYPVLKVGLFKNKFLWAAVISSFALQLVVLYVPGLQTLFDVRTPELIDWAVAALYSGIIITVIEIGKWVTSRRRSH
jgi:Ca2+-transporting ATPase